MCIKSSDRMPGEPPVTKPGPENTAHRAKFPDLWAGRAFIRHNLHLTSSQFYVKYCNNTKRRPVVKFLMGASGPQAIPKHGNKISWRGINSRRKLKTVIVQSCNFCVNNYFVRHGLGSWIKMGNLMIEVWCVLN